MSHLLSEFVPFINLTILVTLLIASRRWTGPSQSARIGDIEHQHHTLRGNFISFQRDMEEQTRMFTESQGEILREVRSLQMNGTKREIKEEFDLLVEKMERLEQTVAAMPCAEHLKNARVVFGKEPT